MKEGEGKEERNLKNIELHRAQKFSRDRARGGGGAFQRVALLEVLLLEKSNYSMLGCLKTMSYQGRIIIHQLDKTNRLIFWDGIE